MQGFCSQLFCFHICVSVIFVTVSIAELWIRAVRIIASGENSARKADSSGLAAKPGVLVSLQSVVDPKGRQFGATAPSQASVAPP